MKTIAILLAALAALSAAGAPPLRGALSAAGAPPLRGALSAAGAPPLRGALAPAVHADTETSTNVPFAAALDVAGRFSFELACRATPSNNVEVAFGRDADGDGVLDLDEIDRVVGWDCGAWFTRGRVESGELKVESGAGDEVRTLSWEVMTNPVGVPTRLTALADGSAVFSDIPLESVYDRTWNMLRLTGRGLDASLENFSVVVRPDGTAVIMR